MANISRRYSAAIKAKVALAAIRERKTLGELASEFEFHPRGMIARWKKKLISNTEDIFQRSGTKSMTPQEIEELELYQQIGKLQMELEWVKKEFRV